MNTQELQKLLIHNSTNLTNEFKRIFHGRGALYGDDWKFLTIDSIDDKNAETISLIDANANGSGTAMDLSFEEIKPTKFGKLHYRMESCVESTAGNIYSEKTVVLFYDQTVVFQLEKRILCWPVW